ncbi:MAG: nucleotidyl transferase AbiEii/AbiGii toxin family protein [Pirellulaceae bacterium]|nr:nucleotidyl transferase AbiEii/AbiGii toxin family protein [Pirellulaceae bacterium]
MAPGNPLLVLEHLRKHDIPLVVIGGYAVTFHGYVRATEDVDIVFVRSSSSENALLKALDEINACWIGNEVDPVTGLESLIRVSAAYVHTTRLMMLVTDLGFLDVFDYVPGCPDVSVEELHSASVQHPSGYRFASLKLLRQMKRASGRPKDLLDLEMLPED